MLTREQIWEIRSSYRNAIDPKKQIGILAELYDTSWAKRWPGTGLPEHTKRPPRANGIQPFAGMAE